MSSVWVELTRGGLWTLPVLALLGVGVVLTLVLGLLTALKIRVPPPVWLVVPTMVVGVSTFGMYSGLVETHKVINFTEVDSLFSSGVGYLAASLLLPRLGGGSLVCLGLLAVWSSGIGGVIATVGAPARTDVRGVLVGLFGPVGTAILVVLAAIGLGITKGPFPLVTVGVLLLSAIGLAVASARVPMPVDEGTEPGVDARNNKNYGRRIGAAISGRGAACLGLVTATAGAAWFAFSAEVDATSRSAAFAPAGMASSLASSGYDSALSGVALSAVGVVGSVVIAVVLTALVGKRAVPQSRVAFGALWVIPAIGWLASFAYTVSAPGSILASIEVTPLDFDALVQRVGDPPSLADVGPQTDSNIRFHAATLEQGRWLRHEATRANAHNTSLKPQQFLDAYQLRNQFLIVRGSLSARAFLESEGMKEAVAVWVRIPATDSEDWPHAAVPIRMTDTVVPGRRSFAVLMSDSELYLWEREGWKSAPVATGHGAMDLVVGPGATMNGLLTLCSFAADCGLSVADINAVESILGTPLPKAARGGEAP
ncbi:MAG: hypothetical protein AB8H79_11295 [Myxococcota bacterium]